MFGQFDRRSPSFINLGCYHRCAGSTAAFDALTCENAGRARWWGGVTPMGRSVGKLFGKHFLFKCWSGPAGGSQ